MKAFIIAIVAVIVISVGAGIVLTQTDMSAGQQYATDAVRLGEAGVAD